MAFTMDIHGRIRGSHRRVHILQLYGMDFVQKVLYSVLYLLGYYTQLRVALAINSTLQPLSTPPRSFTSTFQQKL